jgi:hypothetical protein
MRRFLLTLVVLYLAALFPALPLSAQEKQEETYSISLVQAAEAGKEVKEIDGRKVLTETYEVKSGEYLWRLLRERGLLDRQNLRDVLDLIKRLNPSLTNLDLLHPGETVIIPLVVSPAKNGRSSGSKTPVRMESLKDVDLELYTIEPGDCVIKVLKSRYDLEEREIHGEYLDLLKKMNPSIENIDLVFPGQKIRLPIYSPQVVRMPLPALPASEARPESPSQPLSELMTQVARVFEAMGVEWLQGGQHFIPLKSGGQVNLNADSFPIVNVANGRRIIVDFGGGLPERMAKLITSNWEDYRIVRVKSKDGLKGAIGKILSACGYPKVYRGSEALEVPGDISLRIRADWIIQTAEEDPSEKVQYVALSLMGPGSPRVSASLGRLLEEMGVRVVEYPPAADPPQVSSVKGETLKGGRNAREIVETLLRLLDLSFTRDAEIPVYQGRKSDFNLNVKADFLLSREGRERIIDLTGLGPEIVPVLKDHGFPVLELNEHSDPLSVVTSVLEFTGVPHNSRPHVFLAADRNEARNISITVPGVTFTAWDGKTIFCPTYPLPETLLGFLSGKGYNILVAEQPEDLREERRG